MLAVAAPTAIGCGADPTSDDDGPSRSGQVLAAAAAPSNDAVLGFETSSSWSTTTAGATLGQSTASPEVHDFGTVALGHTGSKEITVTNTSTVTDRPTFWFDSATPTEFGVLLSDDADSCSKDVAPGATCRATVQFTPLTSGNRYAYLMLGNVTAINLRGVATTP